jgi:hypothetical protein
VVEAVTACAVEVVTACAAVEAFNGVVESLCVVAAPL